MESINDFTCSNTDITNDLECSGESKFKCYCCHSPWTVVTVIGPDDADLESCMSKESKRYDTGGQYTYSRLQKYCNKFPTSSSTGFQHSFDNTIGSPLYSGAGTGEFVAILLQSTVSPLTGQDKPEMQNALNLSCTVTNIFIWVELFLLHGNEYIPFQNQMGRSTCYIIDT